MGMASHTLGNAGAYPGRTDHTALIIEAMCGYVQPLQFK